MSISSHDQEELFTATNQMQGLLPEKHPMMVFAREIYPAIKGSDFDDLYSNLGRDAVSPVLLSLVTILQYYEGLSDREVVYFCIVRLDWKIALRIPVERSWSFHSSTLCNFRKRLKKNDRLALLFELILRLVQEKAKLSGTANQRIDASHLLKHLNRTSTTELLFRAVKCVAEEIEKKVPDHYETSIPEHIRERYSKGFSSFGLSKAKRADHQAEIVEDGLYLKEFAESLSNPLLGDMCKIAIMDTIFKENVKITRKEVSEKVSVKVEDIANPNQTILEPEGEDSGPGADKKETGPAAESADGPVKADWEVVAQVQLPVSESAPMPAAGATERAQLPVSETETPRSVSNSDTGKPASGRKFVVEEIKCPKQSIFDPREPELQLGKKGKTSWVGGKCHVVETAEPGKINFITNMILQDAHRSDHLIHQEYRKANEKLGLKPDKVYADGNYISGASVREYRENGQTLMGYMGSDTSKKHPDFKLEKFAVDTEELKAVCPAGRESESSRVETDGDATIRFGRETCGSCKFFQDCVGRNQRPYRILTIKKDYDTIRRRRLEQKTPEFKKEMKVRAQVEGTISEAVRKHLFRKLKLKGAQGRELQYNMIGAAINVKRLIKVLIQGNRDIHPAGN